MDKLKITNKQREKMAELFSCYVDITDCAIGYGDERVIHQSIKALIENKVMGAAKLRRIILKRAGVLITNQYIEDCCRIKIIE